MTTTKLESLNYTTPPRNQGQIVEVSYAGVVDGSGSGWVVERTHDRSDNSISYRVGDWNDDDEFMPWQSVPQCDFEPLESSHPVLRRL